MAMTCVIEAFLELMMILSIMTQYTVGIWGYEMAKKFLQGFDNISHVYLIRGLQKTQGRRHR